MSVAARRDGVPVQPACVQCLVGGAVERLANRATHIASAGDGLVSLYCSMHAQLISHGAGWALPFKSLPGFMCAALTDAEMRDALQWATFDRREGERQAERDARTIQLRVIVENHVDRPLTLPGSGEVVEGGQG